MCFACNDVFSIQGLVVDLDKGKFLRRFGDESNILPRKLYKYLQHELVGKRLYKCLVHSISVCLYLQESPDVQSVYKRASHSSKSKNRVTDY